MAKEELKKEAEEYALKQWEGNIPWSVIQKSYYDGALPREKQIEIDAEQIRALQKQNGELTDRVKELEAQIEKMKCWHNMDYNDKESCKKIPRGIQLLTEYDCGLFVAYCVNRWTGDHWEEHHYGITRWKEIKEND